MKKKAFNRSLKFNKATITKLNEKALENIKAGDDYNGSRGQCTDKTDFLGCEPYLTHYPYCS
ncbi:class I lanthipeptide [Aquimarina sp. AU119]|uniref:class I lanthipeptide n=1 Tax=Aquimarina sp. AU119 TaxID=2108528 RepID=UPI000D69B164|nr:class I lanthipeptide [Aquimarina sp. AU119]